MKRALTYTIIAGNRNCINDCPICISKMTPSNGIGYDEPEVDWEKFREATEIAIKYNAENVLFTGKGEPTLYPEQISRYLSELYGKPFKRIELQTEGTLLAREGVHNEYLKEWRELGLSLIAISIYHYKSQKNSEMFRPKSGTHYDLPKLIEKLHSYDYEIRLSCVMLKDHVGSVEEVKNLIEFAKEYEVEQLTLRTADRPKEPLDMVVADFVDKSRLNDDRIGEITDFLETMGKDLYTLPHGATVYDVDDQNVCMTTGLTDDKGKDEIRQLIFFPQGLLTTSWEDVEGGDIL